MIAQWSDNMILAALLAMGGAYATSITAQGWSIASVVTSSSQAYWSGGRGNSIAATAMATATAKFYPASFSTSTEALLAGTVNYPTGAMSIDIYTPLNVLVDLWTTNVENSTYEIPPDLATGTYRIYFSIPYQSLRKRIDVSYSSLIGASGVNPTLLFGDLDGDNYVSQAEVDFVYSKIGQATYPGKYIAGDRYAIGDCDFNCDGLITLADYNLAAPNVGLTGD